MYCFNLMTGAIKWSHRIIEPFNYTDWLYPYPSLSGNLVYIAPGDGGLYALDAVTGSLRWQHHLPVGSYGQAPLVYRGVVCVGSPDAYVYALDVVTGEFRWRFGNGSWSQVFGIGELQAAKGRIYAKGTNSNSLYALDPQTGEILGVSTFALPCTNGVAYTGSAGGSLSAREIATSRLLWTRRLNHADWLSPTTAGNALYLGVYNTIANYARTNWVGRVMALQASTGMPIWSYGTRESYFSAPVIVAESVYVTSEYNLYSLNATTGEARWVYTIPSMDGIGEPVVVGLLQTGQEAMRAGEGTEQGKRP